MAKSFQFEPPPEAPTFSPTDEEFLDPIAYIDKIKGEAESYGICKIKPPKGWQPPFSLDIEKFQFNPRVQKLNELEASTRIRLNFIHRIATFWQLRGVQFKWPRMSYRALDLYTLYKTVEKEGGFGAACYNRRWTKIGDIMGHSNGHFLKKHYSEILQPYVVFMKRKKANASPETDIIVLSDDDEEAADNNNEIIVIDDEDNSPKENSSRIPIPDEIEELSATPIDNQVKLRLRSSDSDTEQQQIGKCLYCGYSVYEKQKYLKCNICDDFEHFECTDISSSLKLLGAWHCDDCIHFEFSKMNEHFGFGQSKRDYTLAEFGKFANDFKQKYFGMEPAAVPLSQVESEYWRLTSSLEEDVEVEYGSDLQVNEHGSGFPLKNAKGLSGLDVEYAESAWNLNNMPTVSGSVLGFVDEKISGINVPWMYIGMCFSTFCWHTEDHWCYSINYLHWGEPKTWYGVSGIQADLFENVIKTSSFELFEQQPDLLHQLVTTVNPNVLMKAGIRVSRIDQYPGEFIVTFPRAYHMGFNQGFNFAEAVNFATANWIQMGRKSVEHYSDINRTRIFSHDQLLCRMAERSQKVDIVMAAAAYLDFIHMVQTEKKRREDLHKLGFARIERSTKEHQCYKCHAICYLSSVSCECMPGIFVCLKHFSAYCKCPAYRQTFWFRYSMDEFVPLLLRLKDRAELYDRWVHKVMRILKVGLSVEKIDVLLDELKGEKLPNYNLWSFLCDVKGRLATQDDNQTDSRANFDWNAIFAA